MASTVVDQAEAMPRVHRDVLFEELDHPGIVASHGACSARWILRSRWLDRLDVGSSHGPPSALARPARGAPGSELSLDDILELAVHQRQLRVHALELRVLVLQLSQLRQARHVHAGEAALALVVGRLADAVLAARLANLAAKLDLLEDRNDLAVSESGFLHVEAPCVWILYSQLDQDFEEASQGPRYSYKHAHRPEPYFL